MDAALHPSRYLRIEDLRRLRHVQFSSRKPVEGFYLGRHRSPQRGYSVEFNDYREYTPGDDVNNLDWKVFGRSDRLYLKLFEHESDMTVTLLVDGSASMAYAGMSATAGEEASSGGGDGGGSWLDRVSLVRRKRKPARRVLSKYDHACTMAAAIAFLTIKQQDRAAFALAREGLAAFVEPAGSMAHLHKLLRAMEQGLPPGEGAGRADLADAVDALVRRRRVRGRSVLILFSDLLEDRDAILKQLAAFRACGGDAILFHVMHPDELHLPALDDAVFIDSETRGRLALHVPDVREAYERKLRAFLDGWSTDCRRAGIDYNLVSTDAPYSRSLERYLLTRAAMT